MLIFPLLSNACELQNGQFDGSWQIKIISDYLDEEECEASKKHIRLMINRVKTTSDIQVQLQNTFQYSSFSLSIQIQMTILEKEKHGQILINSKIN